MTRDTTLKVNRSKVKVTRSIWLAVQVTTYMDDTIFYATAQSEPLPVDVDHKYSWNKARWALQA